MIDALLIANGVFYALMFGMWDRDSAVNMIFKTGFLAASIINLYVAFKG